MPSASFARNRPARRYPGSLASEFGRKNVRKAITPDDCFRTAGEALPIRLTRCARRKYLRESQRAEYVSFRTGNQACLWQKAHDRGIGTPIGLRGNALRQGIQVG